MKTLLLLAALLVGCGGEPLNTVAGRLSLENGAPLDQCRVTFESFDGKHSATAVTDRNGHYQLGTFRAGDGVREGAYRIVVSELHEIDENPAPRLHARYSHFETSGLEWTVTPGKNLCDLKLAPPEQDNSR